jgi:hypothetical protein
MRTGPPTVVLATTNGTGMGHLSRQLALALASLGGMNPVLFSMSSAVPVTADFDVRAEWCPGPTRGQIPKLNWDAYLSDRITALLEETGASAFVFDGVYPYDGVLRAIRRNPQVPFIWSRRGMWKHGSGGRGLRYRRLFAAVLEPGDLASAGDVGRTSGLDDARKVSPVTLVGNVPQLSREQARQALGLDLDRQILLVTLGSNKRNDLYAAYGASVERFRAAGWQIVVTSSPLAGGMPGHSADPSGPAVISVFPLVKYIKAFDAAVSASGYNAVHELLYSLTPTLLVPNPGAPLDDQATRARVLAGIGLALAADPERPAEFSAALGRLLDIRVRERLVAACAELEPTTGATQAARFVISLASSGPPAAGEQVNAAALHAQRFARRTVARALPAPVLNLIGKPRRADVRRPGVLHAQLAPIGDPGGPPPVLPPPAKDALLVSDALIPGMFDKRYTEHLIVGASDEYVAARAQIARRYYRLGEPRQPEQRDDHDETGEGRASSAAKRAARWAEVGWFSGW